MRTAQIVANLRIECSMAGLYEMSAAVNQMLKVCQSWTLPTLKNFKVLYSKVVVDVWSDVEVLRAWAIRSEKDVARGRKSCVIGGDIESRCLDILPLSKISEEACWS